MNSTMLQGSWTEIKGKIKTQWAKLSDDDLEIVKGDMEQLKGKIQQLYGYGKEQAEIEFDQFKKTITSKIADVSQAVVDKANDLMASPPIPVEVKKD